MKTFVLLFAQCCKRAADAPWARERPQEMLLFVLLWRCVSTDLRMFLNSAERAEAKPSSCELLQLFFVRISLHTLHCGVELLCMAVVNFFTGRGWASLLAQGVCAAAFCFRSTCTEAQEEPHSHSIRKYPSLLQHLSSESFTK